MQSLTFSRTKEYRRLYYKANRDHILALNRACAARRQHLWKRASWNPKHKRSRPPRTATCSHCGMTCWGKTALRRKRNHKVLITLCPHCQPPEPTQNFLFHYHPCLTPTQPSTPTNLQPLLQSLDPRESKILEASYLDGLTNTEIAKQFHISLTRVQQLIFKALRTCRHPERLRLLDYPQSPDELPDPETVRRCLGLPQFHVEPLPLP